MRRILITGGGGYVGSSLSDYLIEKDYEVSVYDLFIYGQNVFKNFKKINLIKGDVRDKSLLKKVLPGHDVVIHLACISNDPSFDLNPKLGKSINLDAFRPLVEISKSSNIKRFIYASSSSVYGIKEEKNVHEEMSLEPITDYSKYKAHCEKILAEYSSEEFTTSTIRPATVCGYSMRQRLDLIVNILTNLAYHKREIVIFGGSQLRPNIHISDMIRAYEKLITSPKSLINKQIFNAGWDNKSVFEIAQTVKKLLGEDIKIKITETNDNRSYHISSQKIKSLLGFEAKFNIEQAIIDLKEAFKNNKLKNTLSNIEYFNIKKMQSIKLE